MAGEKGEHRLFGFLGGVVLDNVGVDRGAGERAIGGASWVSDGPEEGTLGVGAVASGVEVFFEERGGRRMDGKVSNPRALPVDRQACDATTRRIVADSEPAEFAATEGVIHENREDRPITFAFQGC